jgi:hypothetical protein
MDTGKRIGRYLVDIGIIIGIALLFGGCAHHPLFANYQPPLYRQSEYDYYQTRRNQEQQTAVLKKLRRHQKYADFRRGIVQRQQLRAVRRPFPKYLPGR